MASKHGATAEIGNSIAAVLAAAGNETVLVAPGEVDGIDDYDAVVLGSAVYAGRWMADARDLVTSFASRLRERPVWLFSSGPLGDPPKPDEEPVDVEPITEATGAREHVVFSGRLEKKLLGFGERAIVAAFHAPEGDFRDWDLIEEWATGINRSLQELKPSSTRL